MSNEANHNDEYRIDFEILYFDTISYAKKLIANRRTNLATLKNQVRLSRIEISSFDGTYGHWTSFHDSFNALIHRNVKLSEVQELHYLKSSVHGDANDLLHSLTQNRNVNNHSENAA